MPDLPMFGAVYADRKRPRLIEWLRRRLELRAEAVIDFRGPAGSWIKVTVVQDLDGAWWGGRGWGAPPHPTTGASGHELLIDLHMAQDRQTAFLTAIYAAIKDINAGRRSQEEWATARRGLTDELNRVLVEMDAHG